VKECRRKGGSHLTNTVLKKELKIWVCKMLLCVHYVYLMAIISLYTCLK
jgi:hypothetical protein